MEWKKHLKVKSELQEQNMKLDMESMERLREIIDNIAGTEKVISLAFLKDFLRLWAEDDAALEELRIKLTEIGDVDFFVMNDESNQQIYLGFEKK